MSSTSRNGAPSLWKGLVAGLVAGVAATAAKTLAEKFYPPRVHGEPEPPELLSDRIAGHHLDDTPRHLASESIHWGFGAAAGAFYGALAEFYPAVTSKEGANFGLTLMALTHEGVLPAMALSAPPEEQTEREQFSEAATHLLYGIVAERVRSLVRHALDLTSSITRPAPGDRSGFLGQPDSAGRRQQLPTADSSSRVTATATHP